MRDGRKTPEGIWPVLITPLKGGEVDTQSLQSLIKWLETFPIGGFWALGTGSEDHHLTLAERLKIAHTVAETATKPVIMGCSSYVSRETLDFIRETEPCSFHAYHWTPYHRLVSEKQILRTFSRVRDFADSLWAYTSANWSSHVEPGEWPKWCAAGLKFSSQRTSDIQKALTLDIPVMTAVASQTALCRFLGSKRHTSSIASACPDLSIRAWEGDQGPLARLLREFSAKKDNFVTAAEEKALLEADGIIETREVTHGYRQCTDSEAERLTSARRSILESLEGHSRLSA